MSLSGSLGAIPATAVLRRRFTSAICENLLGTAVMTLCECSPCGAGNASELVLFLRPFGATAKAFLCNRKIQAVEALQDTGRWLFCQSKFLDIDTTLGYPSRFLSGAIRPSGKCRGCSSVGRALEWHSRGQGFDSPHLHGFAWDENGCLFRGNSSVGRAQPCQGWGRGFESRFPLSGVMKRGRLAQLVRAPR